MSVLKVSCDYDCFWYAKYNSSRIIVPRCSVCGTLIKVLRNDEIIICRNTSIDRGVCNTIHMPNGRKNDWIIRDLIDNQITEFDENGESTISFRYLPSKDMTHFGLYNKIRNEFYTINLLTGDFNMNGTWMGIAIGKSSDKNKNQTSVTDKLEYYGDGGDLIHFKRGTSNMGDSGATPIENYNIGYKCKVDNFYATVILSVSTTDFKPSLSIKYSEEK